MISSCISASSVTIVAVRDRFRTSQPSIIIYWQFTMTWDTFSDSFHTCKHICSLEQLSCMHFSPSWGIYFLDTTREFCQMKANRRRILVVSRAIYDNNRDNIVDRDVIIIAFYTSLFHCFVAIDLTNKVQQIIAGHGLVPLWWTSAWRMRSPYICSIGHPNHSRAPHARQSWIIDVSGGSGSSSIAWVQTRSSMRRWAELGVTVARIGLLTRTRRCSPIPID